MVVDTSLAVPKADSRAGVHALLAIDKLSVNTKAQLMVSRSHPDVNFRLKRGHAMLQQVSFAFMLGLFCLYTRSLLTRHARTGLFCLYIRSLLPVY